MRDAEWTSLSQHGLPVIMRVSEIKVKTIETRVQEFQG
jgi:hypothetical protein